MGAGMAHRLITPGIELLVYDISPEPIEALVAAGATAAADPMAVGESAEIVLVSLPTPIIVGETLLGARGVVAGGRPRAIVDLSTSRPRLAQEIAAALAPLGIAAFDAPVSGGGCKAPAMANCP